MSSEKQSPIQIKVSASLKRKFEVKCKENGKTITAVLKEFIESYMNDDGSEQEQDTLADADLQQLKDELYSLQERVQSVERKANGNREYAKDNYMQIIDLQTKIKKIDDVPNQLEKHSNDMVRQAKRYVDNQVRELKQMLETSNNNTLPDVQAEDNDGDG